jgi:hypothetical protein
MDRRDEVAFIGNLECDEFANLERGEFANLERDGFSSFERSCRGERRVEDAHGRDVRPALTASDYQLNCQFAPLPALPT